MNRVIISTDMDGTLLGHDSYDCDVARPLLAALARADIPVILNTSKTAAEIRDWQASLGLSLPAIVENGSALLNEKSQSNRESNAHDSMHVFGASMPDLEAFLAQHPIDAINFVTCSESEATALTGLTGKALQAARDRRYSIPLAIGDEYIAKEFSRKAQARGLQCIRGGRFYSLQGRCDKGTTLKRLIKDYQDKWQSDIKVIALGDNQNDLGMLQSADIPIVVKTAGQHAISVDHPAVIYTGAEAPDGWVEGVTSALRYLSISI